LPLKKPSMLAARPMIDALLKVSHGVLDKIMKSVVYSAVAAVHSGEECVTPEAVRFAMLRPPVAAVRKAKEEEEAKERQKRTGVVEAMA
jgi:hypothetical protein